MNSADVLSLYNWLAELHIPIWIDGGWCVDALLGKQTREHSDVDIAVHRRDNAKLRCLLESRGYQSHERADTAEWVYVMKNLEGLQVDVHVFEYDEYGKNVYGIEYPYGSLTGKGTLEGQEVNCVAPEWMFRFKTAYQPAEKDVSDVHALAIKYGLEVPESHRELP
jgi:lincosamide nucleotidyltransferase A/C/D/E